MRWHHTCIREGEMLIEEGAVCPWCGETEDDQLAFEMFFLNLLDTSSGDADQRWSDLY